MTSPTVFCLSVQLRPNSTTTTKQQTDTRQRSPNSVVRAASAQAVAAEPNGNGIIFLRGVRSDNGRIILTRDDTIRLQDGVLSLQSPSVIAKEGLQAQQQAKDKQRLDNEITKHLIVNQNELSEGLVLNKRQSGTPLLLYATGSDVTNGNVAFLRSDVQEEFEQAQNEQPKDEKMVVPVGSDGEPIKLPENLESLPRADHFPTQRHRWNTNEVSFIFFYTHGSKPRQLLLSSTQNAIDPSVPCDPTKPDGYSTCTANCRGRNLCRNGVLISQDICPSRAPYCNVTSLACSNKKTTCITKNTTCAFGYTFDPTDCRRYYFCDGNFLYYYACQGLNSYFSPATNSCVKATSIGCCSYTSTTCCKGKIGRLVPYRKDKTRYVFCDAVSPVLFSCPSNYSFVAQTESCEFECRRPGDFPDLFSQTDYYTCTQVGRGFRKTTNTCPTGTVFDQAAGCIPGSAATSTVAAGTTTTISTPLLDVGFGFGLPGVIFSENEILPEDWGRALSPSKVAAKHKTLPKRQVSDHEMDHYDDDEQFRQGRQSIFGAPGNSWVPFISVSTRTSSLVVIRPSTTVSTTTTTTTTTTITSTSTTTTTSTATTSISPTPTITTVTPSTTSILDQLYVQGLEIAG